MAITAVQGDGVVTATNTVEIQPGAGEEYNITLVLYAASSCEIKFDFGVTADNSDPIILAETTGAQNTITIQLLLTNTVYISLYANAATFNYFYTGYKKT